jgi:UDP:flavonoid glycosyltransferase YjiC (YdhE family)
VRILFASGQGGGHFGPLVPFAGACARAGHEVRVAAPASARAMVERAGFAFDALGEPEDRDAGWAPVFANAGLGAERVIRELFVGLDARAALPRMLELVRRWRPDVIVRETTEFASCVAAERFDVRLVDVGPHLIAATDANGALRALAATALDELGPHRFGEVVLTCAPRSLDTGDSDVLRFRLPSPARVDASLVYVSFGSELRDPEPLHAAAQALAEVPTRVLVTTGNHVDPAVLGPLPANVRAERWVPQGTVMPHAAAMVGHGGSGGTLAALAAGVPLALTPLFVDGPVNAERVEALGAGIVATDVAAAVHELLSDPGYREAAERVADEIRALPPVEEAVAMLSRSG